MSGTSTPIYSIDDVLDTFKKYEAENSAEVSEVIVFFVSELTGYSVDKIYDIIHNKKA